MINKKNKLYQFTAEPETAELLESLAFRFKTSKSIIIKNALKVYASKHKHTLKLCYYSQDEPETSNEKNELIDEKTIEIAKTPWIKKD